MTAIKEAIQLRHDLHRHPELSGSEVRTARRILEFFQPLRPDETITELGGTGLAFVFDAREPGPTVLLRAELDALPIAESGRVPHRSTVEGVAHLCGHDGHMAILAVVGASLSVRRPGRGRVVLLYQPAEETGAGARAVLSDPRFERIRPDLAFALHNLPGFPLGQVVVRSGVFSSASRGVTIHLGGSAAHAAQPETGSSPALAMCRIVEQLARITRLPDHEGAFVTVVGARLGRRAFGAAPGDAVIWATLRTETDEDMDELVTTVEQLARQEAARDALHVEISYDEVFPCTINSRRATDIIRSSAGDQNVITFERPFRWSEDFGRFTAAAEGALFGIGAGADAPDLHTADYDFPDELIPVAASLLERIIRTSLDEDATSR